MKAFISGGSKSGKSMYAQNLIQKFKNPDKPLYYLATMIPTDSEDESRIARHKQEREGLGFQTIEAGRDILVAVSPCDKSGAFLLDSVTALFANEMFMPDGSVNHNAHEKIAEDSTVLVNQVGNIVIVSDNIYSDALLYDSLTEEYRCGLALIGRRIAKICDLVIEVTSGIAVVHKGGGID